MTTQADNKEQNIRAALDFLNQKRPLRTEELCRNYLQNNPGCVDHIRLLSHALSDQNRLAEAEAQLRFALSLDEELPHIRDELGSVLAKQSKFEEAVAYFQAAIRLKPGLHRVHKKLAQALLELGRKEEASEAIQDHIENDPEREAIVKAVTLFRDGELDQAEQILSSILRDSPNNVNAMRYLAAVYWQGKKKIEDAEALVRQATAQAPDYTGAWMLMGALLVDRAKYLDAIAAYKKATELEADNAEAWAGLAGAYSVAMYPGESADAFAKAIALQPKAPGVQMGYGHVLKTLGDQQAALQAYRSAIALNPGLGEVYWSMANLKVFKFKEEEVNAMLEQVKRDDLSEVANIHFNFALGKALEDKKDYDRAWHFYHTGNTPQRTTVEHEPLDMEIRHEAIKSVFSKEFLAEQSGKGSLAPDPIFIVGLPRSGSTLLEQILASHSQVEGTSELPVLGNIADSIGRYRTDGILFPEALHEFRNKDWKAYGQQYLEKSQRHRLSDRPFFTDKLPNNFPLVGLVHLIMPNAKIINARRHPFDSCLGGYKQLFARGQNFTYDMLDLAHYYQQYDAMMKHWHEVLPGKVLDVHYEETVTDLETQVRRILEHCELPFEESCLRFHETERAVKTASSEQVRQPIYQGALGTWRRYEKHLDLWKEQLAYIVDELPEVSQSAGL